MRPALSDKGIDMAPPSPTSPSGSRETLWAIVGSFVLALVLATVLAGNPFRALSLAYLDYSHTPAGGAAKGDPVQAPKTADGASPATPK